MEKQVSKLLIIGGTTEGRIAVDVCDESGKSYYYSTKGVAQKVDCIHGERITGGLDASSMKQFCIDNQVRLIIDAAHPFALEVHRNVGTVSCQLAIPVIRLERKFPEIPKSVYTFDSYDQMVDALLDHSFDRVLALTGVNTIAPLRRYWQERETYFRIMDRPESLEVVRRNKFPLSRILFYDEEKISDEVLGAPEIAPDAIITKESGETGGFMDKIVWAQRLDIPVFVIKRPALPYQPSDTVFGKFGVRRAIEKLLPDFFDLKTGYTTGSTATAATAAALHLLLTDNPLSEYTITLPNDEPLTIPVSNLCKEASFRAVASSYKYAGDDPDVTNGLEIIAQVECSEDLEGISFEGGEGVGRVTLPGLGIPIGDPAINTTPREMMIREVEKLLTCYADNPNVGVRITLTIPEGRQLAQKTFNPRIGVVDGLSIIGTSGIVRPFSSEAFVGAIRAEVRVARSLEIDHLVLNSGAKSERFLKARYPELLPQAFVQYGNFVGEALQEAEGMGFAKVTIGIMIGKAVKLAEGILDTHSHKNVMNREFIAQMAQDCGCPEVIVTAIGAMNMAREIWMLVPDLDHPFYQSLLQRCYETTKPLLEKEELELLLITDEGKIVSQLQ